MKKRIVSVGICLAMLAGMVVTGCGSTKEGTLNLYTWADMFPQEVLDDFEEEYNIKINYTNFTYDEDMLAKLEETKGGDYDFVIADDYILDRKSVV